LNLNLVARFEIGPAREKSHAAPRQIVGDGSFFLLSQAAKAELPDDHIRGDFEAFVPARIVQYLDRRVGSGG
jgi:hypothetical protein